MKTYKSSYLMKEGRKEGSDGIAYIVGSYKHVWCIDRLSRGIRQKRWYIAAIESSGVIWYAHARRYWQCMYVVWIKTYLRESVINMDLVSIEIHFLLAIVCNIIEPRPNSKRDTIKDRTLDPS